MSNPKAARRLVVKDPKATLSRILARTKAAPNGCLIWLGAKITSGYGHLSVDGKLQRVPRVMYAIMHGEVPEGAHILHSCDNRICCNPGHLSLGDNDSNIRDKMEKGRHRWGVNPHRRDDRRIPINARFTPDQVVAIREEYARGEVSMGELAGRYGCNGTSIFKIVHGLTYKRLPGGVEYDKSA